MKKFYISLSAFILCAGISNAQLTLTKATNEPVIGDVEYTKSFDSTTAIPKNTGAGQVWNFTSANPGTYSETISYVAVNSTPQGSLFPNATIAVTRGGSEYEYMKSSVTDYEYLGSTNTSTEVMSFTNTALFYSWPISMGSTFTDLFSGPLTNGTVTSTMNGTISLTATGTGTVMLPGGNIQNNCLQLKRVIIASIVSGTTNSNFSETDYIYYSNAIKSPIISISYSYKGNSPDVNIMVNTSLLPVGLNEQLSENNNVIVYPNPCSEIITFGGIKSAELNIFSLAGKKIISAYDTNTVNVLSLEAGIYFLEIKERSGNKMVKIVKH